MNLSADGRIRRSIYVVFATGMVGLSFNALAQEAPVVIAPPPEQAAPVEPASSSPVVPVQGIQEAPSAPKPSETAVKLDRVEVTGSRIRRVDAEGPVPIEVVSKQQIERAGYQSTEQLLNALSSISTIGGTQLSTGAGSSSFGISTVSLRGLGSDRTLVLVNGRRLAAQAGGGGVAVNVNTIPLAAIERVEVLKDGASSIYGSDAVAGVVNFILKKNYRGLEAAALVGTPTRDGGGENGRFSLTGGYGDVNTDRFNVTGSVAYEKEKALFGRDRNFARSGTLLPFFVSGATGQGNIEGGYTPGDGTPYTRQEEAMRPQPGFGSSPGTGYGNPLAASDQCGSIRMFLNPTPTNKGSPYCAYDSAPDVGLVPDRELINATSNFTFKLAEGHELFADLLWAESKVDQTIQPSPVRRSFNQTDQLFYDTGVDLPLLIRPENPNYQIAADYLQAQSQIAGRENYANLIGQPLAVTARVFDFGGRANSDKSRQARLTLGARGDLGFAGMDYEAAYSHNESKLKGSVTDGYFSLVKFAEVVNRADSDYNPWSLQQSATFNQRLAESGAKYAGPTLNAKSVSDQFDGLVRGTLGSVPAGEVQFATGAQYRQEKYKNTPSPALESGDIAGLGGAVPPVDEDRKAKAVFGEVGLPIFKDMPFVRDLETTAAVRFDDYNDVGNEVTYNASLAWRPADTTLVRASTGSGFRAPTLTELYQPQSLGSSEQFDDPATGQTDLQVNALSGGNPDLKPEKSRQSSIGAVFQPTNAFNVSLDYWRVRIKDAISSPSAQLVVSRFRAGDPAYADLVELDGSNNVVSIIQTLQNTGQLDVAGWDLGLGYRERFGPGRIEFAFTGTYLSKFDETTPSGEISNKVGRTVDLTGAPVIGADGGGVALEWKHILSTTWAQKSWSFTATQNFYKGYEMGHDLNDQRRFVPSVSIYDATVAYRGIKNTTLGFGVKNVFDTDPPLYIPVSNQFQTGYDAALEDPRRRFVYASVGYKFF